MAAWLRKKFAYGNYLIYFKNIIITNERCNMTKEKPLKPARTWYVAATHWLTAGFVMPFIAALVLNMLMGAVDFEPTRGVMEVSIEALIAVLGFGLGSVYAARYIHKKYVIDKPKTIANLAAIYSLVVNAVFVAGSVILSYRSAQKAQEFFDGADFAASPSEVAIYTAINLGIAAIVGVLTLLIVSRMVIKSNSGGDLPDAAGTSSSTDSSATSAGQQSGSMVQPGQQSAQGTAAEGSNPVNDISATPSSPQNTNTNPPDNQQY